MILSYTCAAINKMYQIKPDGDDFLKKTASIILLTLLCMILCSCSSTKETPVPKLASDGSCTVKYGSMKYSCNIKFLSKDVETITIRKPESLNGLTFRKTGGDNLSLSYSSLICRSDSMLLPEDSFASTAASAIHDLRKNPSSADAAENEDGYTFTRSSYTLKTDKNGIIKEMLIK